MGTIFTLALLVILNIPAASDQSFNLIFAEEYSLGPFQRATRVTTGLDGTIYVLDADQNKLIMYKSVRENPVSIGGFGWSGGSFDNPTGAATDGVNVYVSDYGNHRIERFDRKLNYISSFSTRDTSDASARFGYPLDIALSEQGDIFILDGENLRILKFNPLYYFERSFGSTDAGRGKLNNPMKLIAAKSRVYAAEHNRIIVFDYFGNFLHTLGEGQLLDLNGFTLFNNNIITASNDTLWRFAQDGEKLDSIPVKNLIASVKIDRIQDVAYSAGRLLILAPQRLHIFKIGS